MAPYEKHLFVCTNQRVEGHPRGCCADRGGFEIRVACARELAARGLKGIVRANKSGCLDVCELGAAMVIYPRGIWYLGITADDVPEIIETSIVGDGIVDRLVATEADWDRLKQLRTVEKAVRETN